MVSRAVLACLDLCLSVEDTDEAQAACRALVADPQSAWLEIVAEAGRLCVTPTLWTTLNRFGLLAAAPGDLRDYLGLIHAKNAERNGRIRDQVLALGQALAAVGVEAVVLKGAAWLLDQHPEAAADRMMRDVDLLVPRHRTGTAVQALLALGYEDTTGSFAEDMHFHHAPLIPRIEGEAAVELHVDLAHRDRLLPADELLRASSPVAPGLRIPTPEHRLLHAVIHGQIENGDFVAGATGTRDLLDCARLVVLYSNEIAWPTVLAEARERGFWREVMGALHLAHATLGAPLPPGLGQDRSARWFVWRCLQQRRWPVLVKFAAALGVLHRALAWDRDAYGLGLDRWSWTGQASVNRRRWARIRAACQRLTG